MTGRSERETMEFVAGAPDSWLGTYLAYARRLTDAPLAFHLGGGLAVLAAAVGSNIFWYGGGARPQWPNLYVLLIGPSGIRKSTAVDLPTTPLAQALPGSILDKEFSPEQFIRNLQAQPAGVIKESEFSSLLERMKSNYMGAMKQRLTDLYDCHEEYTRSIQGMSGKGEKISIDRPALSILGASTLDWLVESLTETDMRSGFMPRFLIFTSSDREPEPPGGYFAKAPGPANPALVKALRVLAMMPRTRISFDKVQAELVSWCADRGAVYQQGDAVEELGGLYNRLGHHVAKVAVLLRLSDGPIASPDEAFVYPDQAERAMVLVDWIIKETTRLFDERVVYSKFEKQAQEALRLIGSEIDRSALLKRLKCTSNELDRLLQTLTERGEIESKFVQTGGRSKQVVTRVMPSIGIVESQSPPVLPFPSRPQSEVASEAK